MRSFFEILAQVVACKILGKPRFPTKIKTHETFFCFLREWMAVQQIVGECLKTDEFESTLFFCLVSRNENLFRNCDKPAQRVHYFVCWAAKMLGDCDEQISEKSFVSVECDREKSEPNQFWRWAIFQNSFSTISLFEKYKLWITFLFHTKRNTPIFVKNDRVAYFKIEMPYLFPAECGCDRFELGSQKGTPCFFFWTDPKQ